MQLTLERENQRENDTDRYELKAQSRQVAGAAERKHGLEAHRAKRPTRLRSPNEGPCPGTTDAIAGAGRNLHRAFSCREKQSREVLSSSTSRGPVSATRGSSPNSGGSSSYNAVLACWWVAAARRRARRSQPRTVPGGRPSRAAIMRCPWPAAASSNAAMITSVLSHRIVS
jgi:hypothetical protein